MPESAVSEGNATTPANTLRPGMHGAWKSRWIFIFAATGSAVGLGNIWKFPYIAGENGGGAFVLVYLLCIALIGIPVMMAEVLLGRRGSLSPINGMRRLVDEVQAGQGAKVSRLWVSIGWLGVLAGLLILSYYSVIAGWALAYISKMASGALHGLGAEQAQRVFNQLLADPQSLIQWQSCFMLMTVLVVAAGVTRGLGNAVRILMPLLFLLLAVLMVFAIVRGDFAAGFHFLFNFNHEALTWKGVLEAMGHAFFTLSLGMGAIMAYGAYMPRSANIGKTVMAVGILDTVVALMAGLAIFPIVFAHPGIEATAGPGLMFVSLPMAFGNMTGGVLVGTLFFILVTVAAWSSAISLIEPAVAYLVESQGFSRWLANLVLCGFAWVLGLGTVFSFNVWSKDTVAGFTFFDAMDFLTSSVLLPLTGLLIALFAGWVMSRSALEDECGADGSQWVPLWLWVLKWLSPVAILVVFVMGLWKVFFAP